MRVYCLWCKQFLEDSQICEFLPSGCLWPVGVALCIRCGAHRFHGLPTERPGG